MSGEAARILNAGEAMKPQPVNKLSAAAFCAFENIGTSSQGNCGSELSRFPTLAIGKASDQSAVWLFCAVSSQQWFQGLGVSSRAASESRKRGHPKLIVFPFVVGMNHEVRTRRQLR